MAMADIQQLEESIVGLSLLEASQLVKKLEERLGVSAAARAAGMMAGGALTLKITTLPPTRRAAGQNPLEADGDRNGSGLATCSRELARKWRQARNAGTERPIDSRPKRLARRPGELVSQGALVVV